VLENRFIDKNEVSSEIINIIVFWDVIPYNLVDTNILEEPPASISEIKEKTECRNNSMVLGNGRTKFRVLSKENGVKGQ
jgi:hypothetical protein